MGSNSDRRFESFVVCAKVNCGGQLGSMRGHAFRSEVKRSRIQLCVVFVCAAGMYTALWYLLFPTKEQSGVVQPGDPRITVSVNFRGGPFLPLHYGPPGVHI